MTHCTHEQSQALKEIGFDMPTRDYYTRAGGIKNNASAHDWNIHFITSAPTPYEVLDWFRETKGMFGSIIMLTDGIAADWGFVIEENPYGYYLYDSIEHGRIYHTYPEALSALIDKLITILEEQKA